MMTTPALVSPDWLHKALVATKAQSPWGCGPRQHADNPAEQTLCHPVRVLDASWKSQPGYDAYSENFMCGHIPGAMFFDLQSLNESRRRGATLSSEDCPIPEPEVFASLMSDMGVTSDTHVVIYDCLESRGAVRAWFLFRLFGHDRVSVLDGGLRRWKREGLELCTGDARFSTCGLDDGLGLIGLSTQAPTPVGCFKVMFRPELLRHYHEMKTIVETRSAQVIDARPSKGSFYLNDDAEPIPGPGKDAMGSSPSSNTTRSVNPPGAGHMPGAINVPFTSLFMPEGTFKPEAELAQVFLTAGVDFNCPVVATCFRGVTSCALALVSHLLGHQDVPVYNGSWLQWERLAPDSLIVRTAHGVSPDGDRQGHPCLMEREAAGSRLEKEEEPNHTLEKEGETNQTLEKEEEPNHTLQKEEEPNHPHEKEAEPNHPLEKEEEPNHTPEKEEEPNHTLEKEEEPNHTAEKEEEPNHTLEKEEEPNHTLEKDEEPNHTLEREEIPNHTLEKEEEPNHTLEKEEEPNHTLEEEVIS